MKVDQFAGVHGMPSAVVKVRGPVGLRLREPPPPV